MKAKFLSLLVGVMCICSTPLLPSSLSKKSQENIQTTAAVTIKEGELNFIIEGKKRFH